MQRKSSFTEFLITALCVVASGLRREYHYLDTPATWVEAQQYCREHHTDLAFISNLDEEERLLRISHSDDVWIGMYRDGEEWKWSGGWTSTYSFWRHSQPNNHHGNQNCVSVWDDEMNDDECSIRYPFFCFDVPVTLVKENKTWVDALEHCRDRDTDLPSLLSETEQLLLQSTIKGAQTDQVWMGLCFLAGSWLWVNGDQLENQAWTGGKLPHCPAQHLRCGTLAKEGELWGTRDCDEKRNFLCF